MGFKWTYERMKWNIENLVIVNKNVIITYLPSRKTSLKQSSSGLLWVAPGLRQNSSPCAATEEFQTWAGKTTAATGN